MNAEDKHFKYDVAFSLLAQDEWLALEINELLSDRYQTFLYLERQKEIAGTDGELKFKSVFAEESRFVVVLYREGWGQTPWTRMEEEAIRGRAYEEGYDFVKFIPLDEKQTVPQYLPKTQLWINALRHGAKGASAVIEARLDELGATTRKETTVDRAARLHRQIEFENKRKEFGRSHFGVNAAIAGFDDIGIALEEKIAEIESAGNPLKFTLKRDRLNIVLLGLRKGLRLNWHYNYTNTLEGAHLDVEVWDDHPPMLGLSFYEQPRKLQSLRFVFELLPSGVGGWLNEKKGRVEYDSADLAEYALHYYMDNGH